MKLFIFICLTGLLSFAQAFGFSVFGVKPNLALSALIAISFFVENIWQGFLLAALAGLILKFSPGFDSGILILFLIGAAAMFVRKYHPWHYFFGNLISIALATFVFYVILAENLIGSVVFLKELAFNLIAGMVIFAFLSILWQNKIT